MVMSITVLKTLFFCFIYQYREVQYLNFLFSKSFLINSEVTAFRIQTGIFCLAMRLLLVLALALIPAVLGGEDCKIKIKSSEKFAYVYFNVFHWTRPKPSSSLTNEFLKDGSYIEFTCENGFARDELIGKSYVFECTDGKFNKTLGYEDLLCRSTYHKYTETHQISPIQFGSKIFKCDQNGWQAFQVKVRQANGSSKLLYAACFDKIAMRTKFVFQPRRKETPEKSNQTRSDVWGLDRFGSNTYEKVRLTEGYVPKIQKDRITKAFPEKYNPQHPYPYSFNRGHLAPYADFIDLEDKRASCVYLNVAPQWSSFNGNSWSLVERETRDMVKNNSFDWEIYTGTYSSIPTSKGLLYVSPFFDKNGKYVKSYVPVPKLYWKIVYNVLDKTKSKVFVGINNPELKSPAEFTDKYVICKPVPDKNGHKFHGNEFKGFTYECKLEDFLEKLKTDEKIVK